MHGNVQQGAEDEDAADEDFLKKIDLHDLRDLTPPVIPGCARR
jgi:hypothetical protein